MGYIRHHAIIVIGWQPAALAEAHAEAERLFSDLCEISPVLKSGLNGYASFYIPPDGSKEGWPESNLGDRARESFKDWLKEARSRELWLNWAEVIPHDEDGPARIEDYQ